MRIALTVAGLLVALVAQPQDIYKWVDKNGTVHYADQPGAPDATLVEHPSIGEPGNAAAPPPLYTPEPKPPAQQPPPRSLSITSPAPDQMFYGGDVSVQVTVAMDGELRDGDQLLIFLDGTRVPGVSGPGATLTGLTRGTHFLRAAVTDATGAVVVTSPQVTFHLRQPTIAKPPVGPNLRPPPPARPPTG